jgi:hypothetical protein
MTFWCVVIRPLAIGSALKFATTRPRSHKLGNLDRRAAIFCSDETNDLASTIVTKSGKITFLLDSCAKPVCSFVSFNHRDVQMSGVTKNIVGKKIAGALTALGLVLAPVALYADASAPWVGKPRVMKHKAKHVMRKRKSAVRSVRRAPRPAPKVMQPAPEPTYTPPAEPVYTPPPAPEPVYTPPPAPEPVSVPTPPAPVAAAPAAGGGFPILAVLGGLAAIGGIIAVATSSSKSP